MIDRLLGVPLPCSRVPRTLPLPCSAAAVLLDLVWTLRTRPLGATEDRPLPVQSNTWNAPVRIRTPKIRFRF
jgi:hypothetical protein